MSKAYSGGIRKYRLEFVRETTESNAPENPEWLLFSDNVRSFEPDITPGTEGQRGLGDPDFKAHFTGTGSFQLSVEYDLQQWFVDGNSNPLDAAYDALQRDSNNAIPNSHSIVRRMEQDGIEGSNTVNGSTSKDTRQYIVYRGAKPGTVTLTGDPTDAQPIMVTLDYMARKAEVFQVDQPSTDTELDVVSNSSNDTSQTLTIEDEGANTTEDVELDGTNSQSTTASFDNIDALELDAETEGDVTVSENGDDLAVIRGQNSYDFDEGELGVPALGGGSHAGAIGSSYEIVQGDTIDRPSATPLGDEVNTVEVSVENNVGEDATTTGPRPLVVAGERLPEASGTLFGEVEYFDKMVDSLTTTNNTLRWEMDGGNLELDNAVVVGTSGAEESSQGLKEVDFTIEGQGVTIS